MSKLRIWARENVDHSHLFSFMGKDQVTAPLIWANDFESVFPEWCSSCPDSYYHSHLIPLCGQEQDV